MSTPTSTALTSSKATGVVWSSPAAQVFAVMPDIRKRLAPLPLDPEGCQGEVARAWLDGALLGIRPGDTVDLLLTHEEAQASKASFDLCRCASLEWKDWELGPEVRLIRIFAPHAPLKASCSVIVPAFDPDPAELRRCLASIDRALSLIDGTHEILLVDDASLIPVKKHLDSGFRESLRTPIRASRNKQNSGPGVTRNRGISSAINDLLFFVDADNELFGNYFQLLLPELRNGSAVVGCSMLYADSSLSERRVFCAGPLTVEALAAANRCDVGIGLDRKHPDVQKIIAARQTFFPQEPMRHFEDWEMHLFFAILDVARAVVPVPLYRYFRNPGGRNLRNSQYQFQSEIEALTGAILRANLVAPDTAGRSLGTILARIQARVREHEERQARRFKHLYTAQRILNRLKR